MTGQVWEMFRPRNHPSAAELGRPTLGELSAYTWYLARELDEPAWIVYWLLVAGIKPHELEVLGPGVPRGLSSGDALELDPANQRLQRAPLWETALPKAGAYLPLTKEAFAQLRRLVEKGGIPDTIESLHRASRNFQRRRGGSRMVPNALPRALPLLMANSRLPRVAVHHLTGNLPFVDKALTRYVRLNSHQIAFSLAKRCQTLAIESGVLRPPPFLVKNRVAPRPVGSAAAQAFDELNRHLIRARASMEAQLAECFTRSGSLDDNLRAFNAAEAYCLKVLSVAFGLRAPGRKTRIRWVTNDLARVSDKDSARHNEGNILPIGNVLAQVIEARHKMRQGFREATTCRTVYSWPDDLLTPILVRKAGGSRLVAEPMSGAVARTLLNLPDDLAPDSIRHSVATWLTDKVPASLRNYLMRHNQASITLDGIWSNAPWRLIEELAGLQDRLLAQMGASPVNLSFERIPDRPVLRVDLPPKQSKPPRPSSIPDDQAIRLTAWLEENPDRLFTLLKREQLPDRQELRLFFALLLESAFTSPQLARWCATLRAGDLDGDILSFPVSPLEQTPCRCRIRLGPTGLRAARQLVRGRRPTDWMFFPNVADGKRLGFVQKRLAKRLRHLNIPDKPLTVGRLVGAASFLAWCRGVPPWRLTALSLDSLPATLQSPATPPFDKSFESFGDKLPPLPDRKTPQHQSSQRAHAERIINSLFNELMPKARQRRNGKHRFPSFSHFANPEVQALFDRAISETDKLGELASVTRALILWTQSGIFTPKKQILIESAYGYVRDIGLRGLLCCPEAADFEELDAEEHTRMAETIIAHKKEGSRNKVAELLARFYRFCGRNALSQMPTTIPRVENWNSYATRAIAIPPGQFQGWLLELPDHTRLFRMIRTAAALAYYGGLRAEEVEGLRVSEVSHYRGTLEVSIPQGKTPNARRRIELSRLASPEATSYIRDWVLERIAEFRGEANRPYVHLFGAPRRQAKAPSRLLINAVIALLQESFGPQVNLHTLRHSFASWLADSISDLGFHLSPDNFTAQTQRVRGLLRFDGQKGEADLAEVCKLMGHGSPETFVRYYWHPHSPWTYSKGKVSVGNSRPSAWADPKLEDTTEFANAR